MSFFLLAQVAIAHDEIGDSLLVEVWLGNRGSAQVSVTLDEPPANAEEFQRAIAALIGAPEAYVSTEVYDVAPDGSYQVSKTLTQWSASAYAGYDRPLEWAYDVFLDVRPLAEVLSDAAFPSAHIHVSGTRLPLTVVPENLETEFEYVGGYMVFLNLEADSSAEPVSIRYGYPRTWILERAAILFALALTPVLGALWLRRAAMTRNAEEAGYACFVTTRRYYRLGAGFWFGWIIALAVIRPLDVLEFYWIEAIPYLYAMPGFTLVVLGLVPVLPAKPLLFPVYERFPGATWSRKDFFFQGLWLNLMVVTMAVLVSSFLTAAAESDLFAAMAWALTCIGLLLVFYLAYLSSLGFVPQAIEQGELRERVDEIARRAGIPRIRDLHVVYFTKAPLPNAFAANGLRLMVTDYLLQKLTKREVDTIVAHEIGHLRARHPQKLLMVTALTAIPAFLAALVLAVWTSIVTVDRFTLQSALAVAIVGAATAGIFVRHAFSRRYEREADAAAIELSDDPDALITALAKITRLHHMPLSAGRWHENTSTHPSTRKRVERIAHARAMPEEHVEFLLSQGEVEAEHYAIPGSAERDRVFSSREKTRVLLTLTLGMLVTPVLVPWVLIKAAVIWMPGFGWHVPSLGSSPIAAILAASAAGAFAVLVFSDMAATAGFLRMRRELAKRLRIPDASDACFVGFNPREGLYVYEGFTNWDIGFLSTEEDRLNYRGDGTSFSLHAPWIESVGIFARKEGRWSPSKRIRIQWRRPEDSSSRVFLFEIAEARTLFGANRKAETLFLQISKWWEARRASSHETPPPTPPDFAVHGQPLRELVTPARYAVGILLAGGFGYFAAQQFMPDSSGTPVYWDFWVGTASALGLAIATLPQVFLMRDQTPGPPPIPADDPFDRPKEP